MRTKHNCCKTQAVRSSAKLSLSCLFFLSAILFAPLAGCARVTKGPVLLRVSQHRAAIMWETNKDGLGKLHYGEGPRPNQWVHSTTEKVQYKTAATGGQTDQKTAFIHKVWLQDLEPSCTYNYRVAGAGVLSEMYEFRTTPADTDEVTFVVYGDSRTHPQTHRKLVELMKEKKPDFIVNTGDLVSRGDQYEQWGPEFFAPIRGLAERVPFHIAKGNHEGSGGNFERLLVPPGQDNNFSFDYGPLHYLCVDNVSRGMSTEERLRLIAADAANSKAPWKFVSFHVPSLNFGGHWSDWGHPDALPTFAKAGVDFVITGHSHQYERFWPVTPPPATKGSHVTYITTGGGGASLYGVEPVLYHASAKQIHHFCLFHIKGSRLTMDTIDVDGNIIDHLEITKSSGQLNRPYLWTAIPMEAVALHQALYSDLNATLPTQPDKERPFTLTCRLSLPALTEPSRITFSLRGDEGTYELGDPETFPIPEEGGTIEAKLTATALVEIEVPTDSRGRARPIVPALWLDCQYEIGRVQETISKPIMARAKRN